MSRMQRDPCTGECGYCGARMYTVGEYCCKACREADKRQEDGECLREDIGDDCRCPECEERKRAAADRRREAAEEVGL